MAGIQLWFDDPHSWSQSLNNWAFHRASWIAAEVVLIHRQLAKPGPAWLGRQPGHRVVHGVQVYRGRLGITCTQSISELSKYGVAIADIRHLSLPGFHSKRLLVNALRSGQIWPANGKHCPQT